MSQGREAVSLARDIDGANRQSLLEQCQLWEREDQEFHDLVGLAHRELARARRKAQSILANAQTEASSTVEEAEVASRELVQKSLDKAQRIERRALERAAAVVDEAREKAREAGLAEGRGEGARQVRERLAASLAVLDDVDGQGRRLAQQTGATVLDFVLEVAERTLGVARDEIPRLLVRNVQRILQEAGQSAEGVSLAVHPDDLAEMMELAEDLEGKWKGRLVPDRDVPRRECRIRGRSFAVDVSLEERFLRIREEVRRVAGRE